MKFLVPVDLTKNELQNARIQNLPSAPGSPVEGQIYYDTTLDDLRFYDGSAWVNTRSIQDLPLTDLSDVTITTPSGGQYLVYDSGTSQWINADLNINDIVEFNTTSVADGDFLVYNISTSKWVNVDVDTDTIEEGSTNLYYTDTRVENVISAASIDDLSDVTINSAASGELLVWDTNAWVNREVKISDLADPNANVSMNSQYLTDVPTPVQATDAANKAYVDSVAEGLHIHASVVAATDNTLAVLSGGTVTYDNGTAGVGATLTLSSSLATIDGVTLVNGDRILVKNEATLAHNGIYVRTSGTVLTRADDFNTAAEIAGGDFVFVTGGTLYNSTGWVQIDEVNTVGTDPIEWDQFSGAGTYLAGAGLDLNGSVFSIGTEEVVATMIANNAVETAKINNNAVTTAKIADLNVTEGKLANNAVTTAKIAANAVTATQLADNAVDTTAIVANAVTAAKIADNAIEGRHVNFNVDDINNVDLASSPLSTGTGYGLTYSLDVNKWVRATVGTDGIADGSVTASELAANAVTTAKILDANVTEAKIANNAVTSAKIAANAVTTAKILDGNVTEAKLATALANKVNAKTDKYSANVGNTVATSFTVTHNLDTRDVVVHVYDNNSPYAQVFVDVEHTTANTVTVAFATAPATDRYRVVVIG